MFIYMIEKRRMDVKDGWKRWLRGVADMNLLMYPTFPSIVHWTFGEANVSCTIMNYLPFLSFLFFMSYFIIEMVNTFDMEYISGILSLSSTIEQIPHF
jgi:hypothetical protein